MTYAATPGPDIKALTPNYHKTAWLERRFMRANLIETESAFDSKTFTVTEYCIIHARHG